MAILSKVRNFKCFNQLSNGIDFSLNASDTTPNLVGNVNEKVKVTYDVSFEVFLFNSQGRLSANGSTMRIHMPNTDLYQEGFRIGDIVLIDGSYSSVAGFNNDTSMVITDFDDDNSVIEGLTTFSENSSLDIAIKVVPIDFTGFNLRYGLIENEEQFTFQNKLTRSDQNYYGELTPATLVDLTTSGNIKDWVFDLDEAKAEVNDNIVSIEHEFVINPTITNNLETPSYLEGVASLKYSAQFDLKPRLTSPRLLTSTYIDDVGSVGWYGSNFNGFNNVYTVDDVSFIDTSTSLQVDSLQSNSSTSVQIEISKTGTNFISGEVIIIYLEKILTRSDDYIGTSTTYTENSIRDVVLIEVDGLSVTSGNYFGVTATSSGSQVTINFDYQYITSERLLIEQGDSYKLCVSHQQDGESSANSTRVMLIADSQQYSTDNYIPNLSIFDKFLMFTHDKEYGIDSGEASIRAWNEDEVLLDFELKLDKDKEALFDRLEFILVADNGSEFFPLDTVSFDLSTSIIANNIQQVNIDRNRGFEIPEDSPFNFVKMDYTSTSSNFDIYNGAIGFKIKWQEWVRNNSVDPDFYDNTKPNNNFNFKSSNYALGLNGYVIRIISNVHTTGIDDLGRGGVGLTVERSGEIEVRDYDVTDDGVVTSGIITFHDPDTLIETGVVLSNKDTLFRSTWNTSNLDETTYYGIHRIQESNSPSNDIVRLSSLDYKNRLGDILKPKDGETGVTIVNDGVNIITECLIDYTKINPITNYDYSGRVETVLVGIDSYVSFHFREDSLNSLVWEIPMGVNIAGLQELNSIGVPVSSVSYELDEGSGYVSYASFSSFSTALQTASTSGVRNARLTTSQSGYIEGSMFLLYVSDTGSTPTIDIDLEFDKNGFDWECLISFDNKVVFTSVDYNQSITFAVFKVVTNTPNSEDYTDAVFLSLSALNTAIDALTEGVNYSVFISLLPDLRFDANLITNLTLLLQANYLLTGLDKINNFHIGSDEVNKEYKLTGNSLEFVNVSGASNFQTAINNSFDTGTGGQRSHSQDTSYAFMFDCSGVQNDGNEFGGAITLYSTSTSFTSSLSSSNTGFVVLLLSNGIIQIQFTEFGERNNGLGLNYRTANKIALNKKNDVVINYRGSDYVAGDPLNINNIDVYINGVLNPTIQLIKNSVITNTINPDNTVCFGGYSNSGGQSNTPFLGKWRRCYRGSNMFTPTEVRYIHNTGLIPSSYTGLLNDWDFNQVSGNVIDSVNSKDLTPSITGTGSLPSYTNFY